MKKIRKKTVVDTLVVSDLHFRLRFRRLFFWRDGSNPKALLKIISQYQFKRLIINGDLCHDFTSVDFDEHELKVFDLLRSYADPQSGVELVVILGNHDREDRIMIEEKIGQKYYEEYTFVHDGQKHLVTHGDQFDQSLKSKWGMLASDYAEKFARFIGLFMFVKNYFDLGIWRGIHSRMTKKALKHAKEKRVPYILVGHSHMAGVISEDGVTCINSGCFIDEQPTVVVLLRGVGPQIHHFDRKGNPLGIIDPAA